MTVRAAPPRGAGGDLLISIDLQSGVIAVQPPYRQTSKWPGTVQFVALLAFTAFVLWLFWGPGCPR